MNAFVSEFKPKFNANTLNVYTSEFVPQEHEQEEDLQEEEQGVYEEEQGWQLLGAFADMHQPTASPIFAIEFDPVEELVWAGHENGRVSSFMFNDGKRVVSYASSSEDSYGSVRQLIIGGDGVLSLCDHALRLHSRGGMLQHTYQLEELHDMRCCAMMQGGRHNVLAGESSLITVIDMSTGRVVVKADTDFGIEVMKACKYLVCGEHSGTLSLRDHRTLRVEHSINAHSGPITAVDVKENLMVSCALTANMFVDPIIKVYDLRYSPRPLNMFPFHPGPSMIKYHPLFSSTLVVASQSGQFQFCDATGTSMNADIYAVGSSCLTSHCISSSGSAIGFGDANGCLWEFVAHADACVNNESLETEFPPSKPPPGEISGLNQPSPFPLASDTYPLSDWPNLKTRRYGAKPPIISTAVFPRQIERRGFVQAFPNPGFYRGMEYLGVAPLLNAPNDLDDEDEIDGSDDDDADVNGPYGPVSIAYRPIKIRHGKLGIEDFNFGKYNRTTISGLENAIINAYTNGWIQIMYFIPQFRERTVNHLCSKELCLTCELGFLFHMLSQAKGRNCQATNFLRAFRHLPEAGALELLESTESERTLKTATRITSFNRYILEQMHRETTATSPGGGSVDLLFGSSWVSESTCVACKSVTKKESRTFQCRVVYPLKISQANSAAPTVIPPGFLDPYDENDAPTFVETMNYSLCVRTSAPRAWCDTCRGYKPIKQIRKMVTLPPVLSLSTALTSPETLESDLWRRGCAGGKKTNDKDSWMPTTMYIVPMVGEGFQIYTALQDVPEESKDQIIRYDLTSVLTFNVVGESNELTSHLVAAVDVKEGEYQGWHIINDFYVTRTNVDGVINFKPFQAPSIITFTRVDIDNVVPFVSRATSIQAEVFYQDDSLSPIKSKTRTFIPPMIEELEATNKVLGIDAEFVALTMPEEQLRSDGSSVVVKPARMSLGRLSVVRDWRNSTSPFAGVALIDDYIKTPENVVDYLTRWSGLLPGDLDPATSRHHLIPLKRAYLKMRFLVDKGFIFVGHGLKKDFRIINIYVPPEKIIDTVELFSLPKRRKMALRFLAHHLLRKDIQTETHDSIEDARTALALYHKYLDLTEQGEFETILEKLYEVGTQTGWKV